MIPRSIYRIYNYAKIFPRDIINLLNNTEEVKYFCLNPGSCGSKYLVELLKANNISKVYHEKEPDLDILAVRYFLDGSNKQLIKNILLLTRKSVFLESSNRLFSLAPLIKEVFPNAKFIFLYRDLKSIVASNVNKTVFPQIFIDSNRIRYNSELSGAKDLPAFDRMCYYLKNYHETILEGIKNTDFMYLKFEDLIKGEIDELEKFIGIELKIKKIKAVNTKDEIKTPTKKIEDYDSWPSEYKKSFEIILGDLYNKLP